MTSWNSHHVRIAYSFAVLAGYEKDHNMRILEEADFLGVKELCEQYPDLELGPVDLFGFLM